MKISRNWLQKYFDQDIPEASDLEKLFTFHSFEVEAVEKVGEDSVMDVKVLPDRAHYCLSHRGIAGEVSVLTGMKIRQNLEREVKADSSDLPEVFNKAPEFCRRYMARYVDLGVITATDANIQNTLVSIGERSIHPIVDATNYTMFDLGQPLHAFDAEKISGKITIRNAKRGEKISLLDSSTGPGQEMELLETDHVIADEDGPIAIAGVKGGKRAGVTGSTKRIILESANFDPASVRKTATRLGLRSESSKRYENEITPELTGDGMNEVSSIIKKQFENAKFGPILDHYHSPVKKQIITVDPKYINDRLGINVPTVRMKEILESMGVTVMDDSGEWKLEIPHDRFDLRIKEDVVEEVGRVYGYDHIEGTLHTDNSAKVNVLPAFYLTEKIKNILKDRSWSEVCLYTLVKSGDIETAYPLAKDKAFVRSNLKTSMEECLTKNILNADLLGLQAIKTFEIGHVFTKEHEKVSLCMGLSQIKKMKGKTSQIILEEEIKGLFENLGATVPANFKAENKGNMSIIEIDLTDFMTNYCLPKDAEYKDLCFGPASSSKFEKISPYPFIVRDIAVFSPSNISAQEVWSVIESSLIKNRHDALLRRHSHFDTYTKDDKVSNAFRLVFQSMDKTLTDQEANSIMDIIYEYIKAKGWEVR